MKLIDQLINRVTMYRLLIYYLVALLAAAIAMSAINLLSYNPFTILFSAGLLVLVCYVAGAAYAKFFAAPANWESSVITGLILSLIMTPARSPKELGLLAVTGLIAMTAKYFLAFRHKHLFNPAAIAVLIMSYGLSFSASWWVGSTTLLPLVIIGGLLIARKTRRMSTISAFLVTALLSTTFFAWLAGLDTSFAFENTLLRSSLFFLAFVMLTEPWTSPTTRTPRYIYAVIIGLLFAPTLHVGGIYMTPELALVIGNLFAFFVTPHVKTKLFFKQRHAYGSVTEDLEFTAERAFAYKPGQYVEITLPHASADSRGLRRYFTLASSPTEETLRIGTRFSDNGSSFKQQLRHIDSHAFMSAGQLGGDFTLPSDDKVKLAFIAGGIGVTPFRSMIKYLSDTGDKRSVKLLYGERSLDDIVYREVFEEARHKAKVDTTYVIAQPTRLPAHVKAGHIDAAMIKARIPDYLERTFYLSGPQPMVVAMREILLDLEVPAWHIKTDYFFGYA